MNMYHSRKNHISIHSLRMEGDKFWRTTKLSLTISIHSLRMEGDAQQGKRNRTEFLISIHSLRMEGDFRAWRRVFPIISFQSTPSAWRETRGGLITMPIDFKFQSTPSAWRETDTTLDRLSCNDHFNPLPPHGGRHPPPGLEFSRIEISIHSLRMEGDALFLRFFGWKR